MDYYRATFYDKYTPLTDEQILEKLTPVPVPRSALPSSAALSDKTLTLVLDDGPTLDYAFRGDTLTLRESGGTPAEAPYAARELNGILLITHMIPGTVRGYNVIYDRETKLVTVFEVWFGGFEQDKREVWRHFMFGYADTGAPRAGKTPRADKPH